MTSKFGSGSYLKDPTPGDVEKSMQGPDKNKKPWMVGEVDLRYVIRHPPPVKRVPAKKSEA